MSASFFHWDSVSVPVNFHRSIKLALLPFDSESHIFPRLTSYLNAATFKVQFHWPCFSHELRGRLLEFAVGWWAGDPIGLGYSWFELEAAQRYKLFSASQFGKSSFLVAF